MTVRCINGSTAKRQKEFHYYFMYLHVDNFSMGIQAEGKLTLKTRYNYKKPEFKII